MILGHRTEKRKSSGTRFRQSEAEEMAGSSYAEWVAVFYPTSTESKLGFYSKIFPTVEIDSTFYAFPKEGMVIGWDRYSPRNFVFNAKLPQTISHELLEALGKPIEEELD